jgi:hypothetical protein
VNRSAQLFSWTVWAGIVVNLLLVVPAVFAPDTVTTFFSLEPATPAIWLRFSGWLLLLLSLFYVPAALGPLRYLAIARLAVFARFAGAFFFLGQIAVHELPTAYLPFGLADLVFGVVEGILLLRLAPSAAVIRS